MNLIGTDVHLPGGDIEILNRNLPHAVLAGQFNDRVPRKQRGSGVGGGDAVAGVAADSPSIANLGAAHHVHGLAQNVDVFLNNRVLGDMAEAGQGADTDGPVFLQGHAPKGIDTVDGNQLLPGPLALPHLDQHVGAAGEDLGLGVLQAEGDSVSDAGRFVERLYIIHMLSSFLAAPAGRPRLRIYF